MSNVQNAKKEGQVNPEKTTPTIPVRVVRQIKNICKSGEVLSLKAMVCKCEIKEQAGGKKYMIMDIQDSTGVVGAKIWNDSLSKMPEKMKNTLLKTSDENLVCVAIGGIREDWMGTPYINVKGLSIKEGEDPLNYVPSTAEDIDGMYNFIIECASMIEDPYKTILLTKLDNKKEEFISAPAAKRYHDNFKAGLLEHTYKMLNAYVSVANMYRNVNKTIMTFIIIQHDFEKINGYTLLPSIEWTDQEELVGHQVMGAINVYNELKAHNVDDRSTMAILNALLAHHGKAEWGAAKPPMTIEARLLSHLDFMISDIAKASQIIDDSSEEGKVDRDLFYAKYN